MVVERLKMKSYSWFGESLLQQSARVKVTVVTTALLIPLCDCLPFSLSLYERACTRVCMYVCVRACVCVCVRARARACVCVCVLSLIHISEPTRHA